MKKIFKILKESSITFCKKGKRIRLRDENIVFRFAIATLIPIFLSVIFLLNIKLVFEKDWKSFSVFNIQNEFTRFEFVYFLCTVLIAIGICILAINRYGYYKVDAFKQLCHRQELARMILSHKWYDVKQVKGKDLFGNSETKEKIVDFPKMYYWMDDGLIHIRVKINMGKYQDQLLNLEKKLESGLFCELIDKELQEFWVEYTLLYDTIRYRISIDEVEAKDGRMKLMKNVYWEYDTLPHMLIAGGTGGGKTYFLLSIIESLLQTDAGVYVLDPKNADLADLSTVMKNVFYKKEDIIGCVIRFYEEMVGRVECMKSMDGYKTGENYAYLGLPPQYLIFDEYIAFMDMLTSKENAEVLNKLKLIVMLGRQAGFFIILACQRPDAKYLGEGIRDQFGFRVVLGKMYELGYSMMYGEVNKDFFRKPIKGRGYADSGKSEIAEFYTPLVPKEHDFLLRIGELVSKRQSG